MDIDKSNQFDKLKPKHTVLAQFLDCIFILERKV